MKNCTRCKRDKFRDLCPCCDLPRRNMFVSIPVCEHRPEFEDFMAHCKKQEIVMTYLTWWNTVRKPKQQINADSSSYDPFQGIKVPGKRTEAAIEEAIQEVEVVLPVLPNTNSAPVAGFVPFGLLPPHLEPLAEVVPILPPLEVTPPLEAMTG